MNCPCHSTHTTGLRRTTKLGYRVFRCRECKRTFNERIPTTSFSRMPTDIVFQVLLCRLRYKMSFRSGCGVLVLSQLSYVPSARGKWVSPADETYIRVKGKWCYLYRAIDRDGNLRLDALAETRHGGSSILLPTSPSSRCSTTRARDDGWARSYPRAIAQVLGTDVQHRVSDCLTNRIEQDHRGIKALLSDAWFWSI